jgi:predicted transposase/invertase (TIGR01784 family)
LCQLDTGDLVLVEMQVMPENQGDLRFLSYAAGVYSNQLKRGGKTKDIKKVIAINLLGCGLQGTPHWKDAPDEFIRHYKFQEQLGPKKRLIEGIELIQWDLVNTPEDLERYIKDPNLREWILFFKRGHAMTRQQVKENFKNPNVQRAFTLIDYDTLSPELRAGCESLDEFFGKYSDYTESVMREGIEKGIEKGIAERLEIKVAEQVKIKLAEQVEIKVAQEKIKVEEQVEVKVAQQVEMRAREERLNIVKRMLGAGVSDDLILEATKISPAELLELKNRTS